MKHDRIYKLGYRGVQVLAVVGSLTILTGLGWLVYFLAVAP